MKRIYCLQSICLHIFSLTISSSATPLLLWILLLLPCDWSNSNKMCFAFLRYFHFAFFFVKYQIYLQNNDVDVCINIIRFVFFLSRIVALLLSFDFCCIAVSVRKKERITHRTDLFMYINKFIHFNLV